MLKWLGLINKLNKSNLNVAKVIELCKKCAKKWRYQLADIPRVRSVEFITKISLIDTVTDGAAATWQRARCRTVERGTQKAHRGTEQ